MLDRFLERSLQRRSEVGTVVALVLIGLRDPLNLAMWVVVPLILFFW